MATKSKVNGNLVFMSGQQMANKLPMNNVVTNSKLASEDSHKTSGQPETRIIRQQDFKADFNNKSESNSPSSLQSITTDSENSIENNNSSKSNRHQTRNSSKSPPQIQIKYNYYDYNGSRQEQINQDMNYQQHHQYESNNGSSSSSNNNGKIARQLSPTFKQSLDEIIRNSQRYLTSTTPNGYNGPAELSADSSPRQMSPVSNQPFNATMTLARRYKLTSYEQRCLRCRKTVYQMDKVGPLKDFTFYHQNCFKCLECGTKLTLKTYFNNQHSSIDQEVYCHRHCPKTPAGRLDNHSVGIRAALNAPKVFDVHQMNGMHQLMDTNNGLITSGGVGGNNFFHNSNGPQPAGMNANYFHNQNNEGQPFLSPSSADQRGTRQHVVAGDHQQQQQVSPASPQVDSSAMYIKHAVQQTKLQAIYKQSQVDKKISQFLNKRLEYLEPRQKLLEMRHREEEEQLFKAFEMKWRQEETSISEQIRQEWQAELNKLIDKYKRQLSSIQMTTSSSGNNNNHLASIQQLKHQQELLMSDLRKRTLAIDQQLGNINNNNNDSCSSSSSKQMIELERMNLEKTMTIKLDKKKETLKRKLKEFERQATAELVERQSREMLALISMKLEEFKQEQKRKIGSELEQFEAIESLANQLGASLRIAGNDLTPAALTPKGSIGNGSSAADPLIKPSNGQRAGASSLGPPPPMAPQLSKMELYNSEQPDEVFKEIDQLAINVAREDQQTFTDLVHHLTRNCLTDVEKVRAIFRWITVKNLNTMQFDPSIKADTPLGLLRGIKQGSESYHVLFKRLCSYAGLHCVVIKGYSKSAGYQPGVRFEGNRFRNSWNAVFVAGAWRFVQCNWGARHLVSVAVMQDKNKEENNQRQTGSSSPLAGPCPAAPQKQIKVAGRSSQQQQVANNLVSPNLGRRGHNSDANGRPTHLHHHHHKQHLVASTNQQQSIGASNGEIAAATSQLGGGALSPASSPVYSTSSAASNVSYYSSISSSSSSAASSCASPSGGRRPAGNRTQQHHSNNRQRPPVASMAAAAAAASSSSSTSTTNDSLRYEYDDHYFLTDPDEFIYEFYPFAPEWQLLKSRPLTLDEFEQLPFVRSLFFKYGLYFPQPDIRSVLYTDTSGATTIKIGMPTHMVPSLIFHCNLKYFNSDQEQYNGISLKRFVMQSVESGTSDGLNGQILMSNIVSFRVHLPENGAYILDIFANSTTPTQYITGEPMKFKSVCKFKIIVKNLKTVMIPLPDCASGEYGPMKATRLFGLIPITHENGLITVSDSAKQTSSSMTKRSLEIQFRMTRTLLDFMASLHKNGHDERQLSKLIRIYIEGDIVYIAIEFPEDGQYGLDIYTRDTTQPSRRNQIDSNDPASNHHQTESKKQLLTHCCKYLINVRGTTKR